MRKVDVIIIGGSAAGVTAAITSRRHYPEKEVLLVRKEKQVTVPCGIPYIFGTIGNPEKNLIPDALLEKNEIKFIIGEVKEIDRQKKTISVDNGETIGYDKLILATGSSPIVLPIPGIEKRNVFTIKKNVSHLKNMLDTINRAKDIVIIGGGFIGIEFADECRKNRDCNIAIVEMLPHCLLLAFDEEFCVEAETILTENGVKLFLNSKVEAILGEEKVNSVRLSNGREIKADVVIVAVGVMPNVELAKKAGLKIGETKAILVDQHMRTTIDQNIFACGDCAEKTSFFSGKPSGVMLASIATMEARVAGANLFVLRQKNVGSIGVFSTIVDGRAFACAGLIEGMARQEGYNIVVGESNAPNRHPGSMPGATQMKVKLIFEKETGIILGGEISGGKSAGELINVISACVLHKMTAHDISVFQMGTHPALTTSPIPYQLVNASQLAVKAMRR